VNALCTAGPIESSIPSDESSRILEWLRSQQYREVHPYTNAAPGGWAWTDLSGGVPDADDTPGALIALWNLCGPQAAGEAAAGIEWLLNLQNADGGMPTFCRGWGVLPFDRSSADLTAHALRAFAVWRADVPLELQSRIDRATDHGLRFLERMQRPDGAWAPLWFGNQHASTEENLTYGTSRVVLSLATRPRGLRTGSSAQISKGGRCEGGNLSNAVDWLISNQNPDGGWGGERGTVSSIEETALALDALCAVLQAMQREATVSETVQTNHDRIRLSVNDGLKWLVGATDSGREFPCSPIGFYFAKLWYYEKCYPVVYTLAAVGRAMSIDQGKATNNVILKPAYDDAVS
jgi:squalene-hopene/tetraprenyl-beta-curcumene cyclase